MMEKTEIQEMILTLEVCKDDHLLIRCTTENGVRSLARLLEKHGYTFYASEKALNRIKQLEPEQPQKQHAKKHWRN